MNLTEPRKRLSDGRWVWAMNRGKIVLPHGYCAGWPYDDWLREPENGVPRDVLLREAEQRRPFKAKYHTDGHATKEEAARCHWQYELDTGLTEIEGSPYSQVRCEVRWDATGQITRQGVTRCEEWTQRGLGLASGGQQAWLCTRHRTREIFERIFVIRGAVWEIYS